MRAEAQPDTLDACLTSYGIHSRWFRRSATTSWRLLVVYAHPDDETFSSGGTIARYSAEGAAVHYACATNGECGTADPQLLMRYGDITALRTAELTCAAQALGMVAVHFLGHRDSGMLGAPDNLHPHSLAQAPLEHVTGQVTALIRALRPHVIITHGPYGGYGHPDHIKVHQAVLGAYPAAGDLRRYVEQLTAGLSLWKPSKLYVNTFNGTLLLKSFILLLRLFGKNPRRFGMNGDVDLVTSVEHAPRITTTINARKYASRKEQAWHCHHSQVGSFGLFAKFPGPLRRHIAGVENYSRVMPPWDHRHRHERDLFAGLEALGRNDE